MGALPIPAVTLPPLLAQNFASLTTSLNPLIANSSFAALVGQSARTLSSGRNSTNPIVKSKDLFFKDGTPVVSFTSEEISALASPFALTLIGKFSNHVPHIADIAPSLLKLKLKGRFHVSFLDSHHLVIRLFNEDDYNWLWLENSLFVASCYMRIFKWSPLFIPTAESPIVPVWVTLKKVPIMLFSPDALFEIVKPLGKLLKLDQATTNLSRLDRARVCVELDVSKPRHEVICVDLLGIKVNIKVIYDGIPLYCDHCHKLGHEKSTCFVLQPCLKPSNKDSGRVSTAAQPHQVEVSKPIDKRDVTGVEVDMVETETEGLEAVKLASDNLEIETNLLELVEAMAVAQTEEEVEEEDGILLSNSFGALANVIEEDLPQAPYVRVDLAKISLLEKERSSHAKVAPSNSRPPRQAKSRAVANLAVWTNAILGKRTPGQNHSDLPLTVSVLETQEKDLRLVTPPLEKDGLQTIELNSVVQAASDGEEENPFAFDNYFEPDPGESTEENPLSTLMVFEPCINKHNRRKSEGSSPFLADHFKNFDHYDEENISHPRLYLDCGMKMTDEAREARVFPHDKLKILEISEFTACEAHSEFAKYLIKTFVSVEKITIKIDAVMAAEMPGGKLRAMEEAEELFALVKPQTNLEIICPPDTPE